MDDDAADQAMNGMSPAKKVPAKKAAAKKVPAKKAAAKKAAAKSQSQQAKFPRHSVEKALRIPTAIYEQNAGKPCTVKEAATFTGAASVSGNFNVEVSSAKKYGFLEGVGGGKVELQERARRAIAPQSDTDRRDALREAILEAADLAEVYSHYRGENLPDDEFFRNALTDRFKIPAEKVPEFLEVFFESVRAAELLDGKCSRSWRRGWHPRIALEEPGEGVDGGDVVLAGGGQVAA